MKKIIIAVIVVALFAYFGKMIYKISLPDYSDTESDLILYWGKGCPHCETVKNYIRENKLDDKLKISYREVYYDNGNQTKLEETTKLCPEIDTTQGIGVPLSFDPKEKKCILGDQPAIEWLKNIKK
jgi:glutaredoxin